MNRKVINVSKAIMSIIIIIDVILITSTVVFDVPYDFYQKIVLFDIVTCIILLFDFFTDLSSQRTKSSTFMTTGLSLSHPYHSI